MNSTIDLLEKAQRAFKDKKHDEAKAFLEKILKTDQSNYIVYYILGLIAAENINNSEAIDYLEKAASLCDKDPKVFYNYGLVLQRTAQYGNAITQYEKALSLKPDYVQALNNYSTAMLITGNMTKAEAAARKIIEINPSHVDPHVNLGNILKDTGYINEAIKSYKSAISLQPENGITGSNMLLCMCYSDLDAETVFREHKEWEERVAKAITCKPYANTPSGPDKSPLRIGYISADYKTHSVAFYIEPILANHDSSKFEIFCYSDVQNPDPMTIHLKSLPFKWRSIVGMNNKKVSDMINEDGIDILVDLSGHAGKNRLPLFLRKPAPIQVTYLGYPNTTGLSTMDYRLTDALADLDDQDRYYTEKLYRLSDGFLCYRPPHQSPPISEAPMLTNGFVTFGSFNNLPKYSSDTIKVWSEILKAIPNSKIMIKTKPFNDETVKTRYKNMFVYNGIDSNRLLLTGHSPSMEEHLKSYNQVDIALDTFPYNGTTTTCEALWMGVPVITMAGKHHRGRVGVSLLSRIGLSGMIAENTEKYIALASFLAEDATRLSKLRMGLRTTIAQSPLCNSKSFTKTLEKAYRDMWVSEMKH